MPTDREIEAGARALAGKRMHPTRIRDEHVEAFKDTARLVLVAAEAARISAAEQEQLLNE